jgi:hypothetical protein
MGMGSERGTARVGAIIAYLFTEGALGTDSGHFESID